jgi:hypothetical protein
MPAGEMADPIRGATVVAIGATTAAAAGAQLGVHASWPAIRSVALCSIVLPNGRLPVGAALPPSVAVVSVAPLPTTAS